MADTAAPELVVPPKKALTKQPSRLSRPPVPKKLGRQLPKGDNEGPFARSEAKKRWAYAWNDDHLELAPADDEASAEGEGPASSGQEGVPALLSRGGAPPAGSGEEEHGFDEEEVFAAVTSLLLSEDLQELHEAATVVREVSAAGAQACKSLLAQNACKGLLRCLALKDEALEEDASLCFLNLLSHEATRRVVGMHAGLLPLVDCLKNSKLPSTKANIAAALGLITQGEAQTWTLLTSGALPVLMDMLRKAQRKASSSRASSPAGTPRAPSTTCSPRRRGGLLFSPSINSSGDTGVHDACLALMHLSRFKAIRKALLKMELVPLLADVAAVAAVVDSEETVAALFQMLARTEMGPEAICLEHNGVGADALVGLVLHGMDATQGLALDAIRTVTAASEECAQALAQRNVMEQLSSIDSFEHSSPLTRKKIMALRKYLATLEKKPQIAE